MSSQSNTTAKQSALGRVSPGLFAGLVVLAFAWSVSRLRPDVAFAPVAVAERLVRLAPGDAATLAIESLGKLAAQFLEVGVIAAFIALAAGLPLATTIHGRHHPYAAGAVFAVLVVLGSLSAPVPPSAVPTLAVGAATGVLYAVVLDWLAVALSGRQDEGRRRVLTLAGTAALGLLASGWALGSLLGPARGPNTAVRLRRPSRPFRPRAGSLPAVPGLSPDITSVEDHYVVDIDLRDPVVEADGWRLTVGGLVDRPLELDFAGIQSRFAVVEEVSALTCISNEVGGDLVGSSAWSGVRLADVLRSAGPRPGAKEVVFGCADGYDVSIALARALEPSTLLALGHNGLPLTQAHGFPCRVRVPSLYGMMNPKWITSIEVVGDDRRGYWAKRGWSDTGEVRTQSRIDTRGPARAGVPTWIGGVAWAGTRQISGVEVSFDGGRSWREAMRGLPAGPAAWTRWAISWTPDRAGVVRVRCRAVDGTGRRQDARRRRPHPDGATGFHAVDVEVLR